MNHTPGPWSWQGEDYRCGWGWQLLVGPNKEGLLCGQDADGPCKMLRAHVSLDPAITTELKYVHVQKANADLIKAAPDMFLALTMLTDTIAFQSIGDLEKELILKAIEKAEGA